MAVRVNVTAGWTRHRERVTTRCRLWSHPDSGGCAATVGNIVGYLDATSARRRRAVVAAMIAFWVAVIGAESAQFGTPLAPEVHGPHALIAHAADASVLVAVEHPHVSRGDIPLTPDTFAEAVLPRGTVSLLVLALIVVLVGIPMLWRHRAAAAPRGPPRDRSHTLSGREVLARLCIARR